MLNIEAVNHVGIRDMSAIFIRDPDRNVIELDAYGVNEKENMQEYSSHL